MYRKWFVIFCLSIISILVFSNLNPSTLAAQQGQEGSLPEAERPDQTSYHSRLESMSYLPGRALPDVQGEAITSPVEGWSKMAFESYLIYEDEWEIYSANGDFTNLFRMTHGGGADSGPRINRGGTRIVFFTDRGEDTYDIYTVNLDGSNLARLTNNTYDDARPVWSPDGTHIAFESYRDGNSEIYTMHADGSGLTRLTNNVIYDGEPTWSPDGSKIAFSTYRNEQWRIWVMNADGTNQVQLSSKAYSELPNWSPDGSKIAFDADADYDNMQELWVINPDGTGETLLINPLGDISLWTNGWSPDGSFITFTKVELVYQNPYWYWTGAYLCKSDLYGYYYPIAPYRSTDFFLDWTTTDKTPPTVAMGALPDESIYQFTVSWSGTDGQSGLKNFDVQVRDGASGAWADWKKATYETSAEFTGIGGHEYYFRVRGRDNAHNLTPWPANPQTHTRVESYAPLTQVQPLELLIRGNQVALNWEGYDPGGSGILYYDVQFMDEASGVWQDWLTNVVYPSSDFYGEPGHAYHFRSRGTDNAMNVEAWPAENGDTGTTFFNWITSGIASDNTGTPVIGMQLTVDQGAFISAPSDEQGSFTAYWGGEQDWKIVSWAKDGYEVLPPTAYGREDAYVDVVLPPADNVIADWGFESSVLPGDWVAAGIYSPTLDLDRFHSGGFAAFLGMPPSLEVDTVFSAMNPHTMPIFFSDDQGGLHMAWTEGQWYYNPHQYYYMHRLPDGTWLSPEMVYQTDLYEPYKKITMAVDADSNVHLLIGADDRVYHAVRDPISGWSVLHALAFNAHLVDMTIDDASVLHAAFLKAGVVKYIQMEPGGGWQIEPLLDADNYQSIKLWVNPNGSVSIGWISYTNSQAIVMQRSVDGTWNGPTIYTYPDLATIDIAVDSVGVTHVVLGKNPTIPGLLYTALYPDGTSNPPEEIAADIWYPMLLIDVNNTLYLLSPDDQTYTEDIKLMEKPANGEWTFPLPVSIPGEIAVVQQVTVSPSGDLLITWWVPDLSKKFYNWRHAGVWSGPISFGGDTDYIDAPTASFDQMDGITLGWHIWGDNPGYHFMRSQRATVDGDSTLSQSLSVPADMLHPTLSFLAFLGGVSDISGNGFGVQVTDAITTTKLFTSTTPTAWEHYWFDMSPWSGEQITVTFNVTEHAGFPPAQVLLDEVTIGAAHPDVWVKVSGEPRFAGSGDLLNLVLDYGNRGGAVMAESTVLTFTLPDGVSLVEASVPPDVVGNQLVWQLGDLPAGSIGSINITLQVDTGAVLGQQVALTALITTTSAELEQLNNQGEKVLFLGYANILPIIRR